MIFSFDKFSRWYSNLINFALGHLGALVHKSSKRQNAPIAIKDRSGNFVTFGHSQMCHVIERRTADKGLRPLGLNQTSGKLVTKDGFEAKNRCFCQRTDMISRCLFPILAPMFADVAQVLVSLETLRLGIAMFPDARILARWDQDFSVWGILVQVVIHLSFIIAAIGGETVNRLINLFQQRSGHTVIADAILGQCDSLDLATIWIHAYMQFAP